MAKILSEPELKKVKCESCRATIGYLPEEVEVHHGTDYSGSSEGWKRVKCPRENCPGYGYIERW